MRKVKICDFADVVTGGTPSTSVSEYWDNGDIPWLQSGACQNCIISHCDTFITQKGLNNSSAKMMKPGSVLIALTGATTGKVGFLTFDACANQSVTGIQPNDRFVSKYLYYYLKGIRKKILDDSYGGAQKHISQGYVKNLEIPLGTIQEQLEISNIFEKIDEIIIFRQEELKMLDELIKARFVEMFRECSKVKLSELATITMGQSPTSDSYNESGDGLPFFQGKADYGDKYTIIRHYTNKPTKVVEYGTVLMSVRAPVGPVNIASEKCCLGRGLCGINAKPKVSNNVFIFNAIRAMENEISQKGTGSTFKAISKNDVLDIELPEAAIQKQNQFATFVARVDKSKLAIQKSLDKTQLLFDSLMQEYFG